MHLSLQLHIVCDLKTKGRVLFYGGGIEVSDTMLERNNKASKIWRQTGAAMPYLVWPQLSLFEWQSGSVRKKEGRLKERKKTAGRTREIPAG